MRDRTTLSVLANDDKGEFISELSLQIVCNGSANQIAAFALV